MFSIYDENSTKINMFSTKVVEDLLITGNQNLIKSLLEDLKERFALFLMIEDSNTIINEINITQHPEKSISISIKKSLSSIKLLSKHKDRRKNPAPYVLRRNLNIYDEKRVN